MKIAMQQRHSDLVFCQAINFPYEVFNVDDPKDLAIIA